MATYTPPSISNYNDNPPTNDGSTNFTDNGVDWNRHIDEIGDPVVAYVDAVNAETDSAFDIVDASRSFSGVDFGIVGDGVTDDITAINSAITTISQTGGTLLLQAGSYMVSSKIIMKKNVTIEGVTEQGSIPSVRIIGTHAGDVVEVSELIYLNGGLMNLSLEKDTANINTGIGLKVTGGSSAGTVCGNGFIKGCYITKTLTGIELVSAIYWQMEDLQIKAVTNGIYFKGAGTAVPANNFCYGKNIIINASVGVGIGLLYEGSSKSNILTNVDLSGCVQALKYDSDVSGVADGFNNIIDGLWLEANTSHFLLEEGLSLIIRNAFNSSTVDLIDSSSIKPEILRIRGYQSIEGSSRYTIGSGAREYYDVIPSTDDYTKEPDSYVATRTAHFTSHENGSYKNLLSLSSANPYFGAGAPKKNYNSAIMTGWGGSGTILSSVADPWGGTTGFSINGQGLVVPTMSTTVASMRVVACGLVKGSGVEFLVNIQGSSPLFADIFTLKDDNWYLFVTIRDIPSTDTGSTATLNITSDGLMSVCRVSIYEGDGCIIPMEYGADTTGMYSVAMQGPNLRCVGPVADPTVGRWINGDRIDYQSVNSGSFMGRVCTITGSQGTWDTWGAVS